MYELTVKTRRDLERATLRAQAQKPRIVEVAYGMYKSWSTNPATPLDFYYTGIEAASDGCGGYSVCCSCPTTRFLCKHVAACFPHFLMREQQELAPADFAGQVKEIKAICADTTAQLAAYTEAEQAFDKACLFG
jgi:hypothetical protein